MNITLIISGGIAAYKSLALIRALKSSGHQVIPILTEGAQAFITPLSAAALAENAAYTELFDLKSESEMGHIRLSRESDLLLVAPASADLIAKMALGLADDLASATLLASNKPVWIAPAMNPEMWRHPATQSNVARLRERGVRILGPDVGDTACGEVGTGRMLEPEQLSAAVDGFAQPGPLHGQRALVTAGPTCEALDAVRVLTNRSSGRQGFAIAEALAEAGAEVLLVSGPVALPSPSQVSVIRVESAAEMLAACRQALPVDLAIFTAAVSDWKAASPSAGKNKKNGSQSLRLELVETDDVLASIASDPQRPKRIVGFAAETVASEAELARLAEAKRQRKGADWLVANNVAQGAVFDADRNQVLLLRDAMPPESWPEMPKQQVAQQLVARLIDAQ